MIDFFSFDDFLALSVSVAEWVRSHASHARGPAFESQAGKLDSDFHPKGSDK